MKKNILISSRQLQVILESFGGFSKQSSDLLGGVNVVIPGDGAHAGQEGWQSYNAWDIKSSIGTPVYSLSSGEVITWRDYGDKVIKTQGKKLYGQSFTIKSYDGLPKIYYTHLKSSKVRKGDSVKCGQLLGYIMDFPNSDYDHVHIGIEPPGHIEDFLTSDGTLKCNKDISIQNYQKDPIDDILDKNEFIREIKKIALKDKVYRFIDKESMNYDSDVENLQIALQFLGFSLPKWGVDGLYGPETEEAVIDFENKYSLDMDGELNKNDLQHLTAALVIEDFVQSDLQDIQYDKEDFSMMS